MIEIDHKNWPSSEFSAPAQLANLVALNPRYFWHAASRPRRLGRVDVWFRASGSPRQKTSALSRASRSGARTGRGRRSGSPLPSSIRRHFINMKSIFLIYFFLLRPRDISTLASRSFALRTRIDEAASGFRAESARAKRRFRRRSGICISTVANGIYL